MSNCFYFFPDWFCLFSDEDMEVDEAEAGSDENEVTWIIFCDVADDEFQSCCIPND